jgi:hypothetical protein
MGGILEENGHMEETPLTIFRASSPETVRLKPGYLSSIDAKVFVTTILSVPLIKQPSRVGVVADGLLLSGGCLHPLNRARRTIRPKVRMELYAEPLINRMFLT